MTYHADKGPYLRDLHPGDRFTGFYAVRTKKMEPFRDPTRGYFLSLVLSDASGYMQARIWEDAEAAERLVESGSVIKLEGEVELFQEQPQVRILRYRLARSEEYDPRDFVPSSPRDPEELLPIIFEHIERISQPDLHGLVQYIFQDPEFVSLFRQAPESKRVHHAYLGGLLQHTVEALALAGTVHSLYPQIDNDLLMTGILLHDIGKIREFSWDISIDSTLEGRLIGHIPIGDQLVVEALRNFPEFPQELALRVRHMILAHQDKPEWGSPVQPQTLEAIALHQIEHMVFEINRAYLLLERRTAGEPWTPYDSLSRRQLYGGIAEDGEESPDNES